MNWSRAIRQVHRWVSMAFTAGVIANFIILGQSEPAFWIYLLALVPLAFLFFTGLYLFALPYMARRRSAGAEDPA